VRGEVCHVSASVALPMALYKYVYDYDYVRHCLLSSCRKTGALCNGAVHVFVCRLQCILLLAVVAYCSFPTGPEKF